MSLTTKLKKLQKMSADELRCRARDELQKRREAKAYRRGAAVRRLPADFDARALLAGAAAMTPGASDTALRQLETEFPAEHAAIRSRAVPIAQRALAGRLRLLAREVTLPGQPRWQVDPLSGFEFARRFYADVPAESLAGRVDVKYVWELNRHQFLVELSRGYLLTGDEQYAVRCQELLTGWVAQNPLYEGVNWTSALEAAMRVVSWQWTLAGLSRWNGWQDGALRTIATSMIDHAEYLRRHLSWFSSPYNHLMGEAAALYLAGQWLAAWPEAGAWRQEALEVFERRAEKQFYADGFTVEQGSGYHWYTLGFLLLVSAGEQRSGRAAPSWQRGIPSALSAGAALMRPDGRWPAIGDVDSARSLPVQPDDFWDFRGLAALGVEMFGLAELKGVSPLAGEETFWLRGIEGVRRWHALAAASRPLAHVLPTAGYAIAASGHGAGADWLCFDAGPIADGLFSDDTPSVAHGHLDLLQALYCAGGRPVLVDGGMPDYYGDETWLSFFRGVSGHNTLHVEGSPLAVSAGRLGWHSVRDRANLEACLSDDAWLCRGTLQLTPDVSVERSVFSSPGNGLWLADVVHSDRPRAVEWSWNLAPPVDASSLQVVGGRASLEYDGGRLEVCATVERLEVRLDLPSAAGPAGWVCPEYGARTPIARVVVRAVAEGRLALLTSLRHSPCGAYFQQGEQRLTDAEFIELPSEIDAGDGVIWQLTAPGREQSFVVDPASQGEGWTRLAGAGDLVVWRRTAQRADVVDE